MRRAFNDAIVSAGALTGLLTLLVVVDSRVRDQVFSGLHGGRPTAEMVDAGSRVHDLAGVIFDVLGDAFRVHTGLALFVVIATVLTVFMVRT